MNLLISFPHDSALGRDRDRRHVGRLWHRLPVRPEAEGPHSKIRISSHTVSCGGQMATALAACATLGLRSKFAGVIGSDDNGTRVQEALVARGVDVTDAVVHHGPNQFAVILVDERAGRAWFSGAATTRSRFVPTNCRRRCCPPPASSTSTMSISRRRFRWRPAAAPSGDRHERYRSRHDRTDELVAAVSIPILAEHVPAAPTGESRSDAPSGCFTSGTGPSCA